jgi:N-hydroxyarylamine O-acetyltransferase
MRCMLDFGAYLRRISLDPADRPTWQAVHRSHATVIPFENLDSHRGIPISLEQADLERKLVASRRGGYCFEHNLLLASALEHMGLEVEPMLARVIAGGAPRQTRPAGHLALRVTDGEGRQWHADVGFGLGTLLDPIPFGPTGIHEQSGWSFQVVADGDELVLQTLGADGWTGVYTFAPRPAFRIDIDVSNWWTCTNPASPFVSGLIVAVSHDDGSREALYDFSGPPVTMASTPDRTETAEVQRAAIPSLLAQRFGLPGFALGPDGRVIAVDHA